MTAEDEPAEATDETTETTDGTVESPGQTDEITEATNDITEATDDTTESTDQGTGDETGKRREEARAGATLVFDGVLGGVLAVLFVRATLGTRPVALPTGASTVGVVLHAALVFAASIGLSVRTRVAAHGRWLRVNALVAVAAVYATGLVALPAVGIPLENWAVSVGSPFTGFVFLSVFLVPALLAAAFVTALDRGLLLRRGVAAAVDGVLALAATYVLAWVVVPLVWRSSPTGTTEAEIAAVVLVVFACSALVRIPFEAATGRSPGKYVAGIRVTDGDGNGPTLVAVLVRNVLRPIDSLPFGYVVGVGWGATDGSGDRIGDTLAGTRVVRVRY